MNQRYIELALIEKIQLKDQDSVTRLIDLIQNDKKSKIDYIDKEGKSFLHHAISVGLHPVAVSLYALLRENEEIIFGKDSAKQNCLHLAASRGYADMVKDIINQAKFAQPNTPGYKIWLKVDEKGNSPLHIASVKRKTEVANLLINEIIKDKEIEGISHINRINEKGNTPLHLACLRREHDADCDLIASLINNGADFMLENDKGQIPLQYGVDFTLENDKGQTPFQLICQYDFSELATIFSKLENIKDNKQQLFLSAYREYAKEHLADETIRQNYLQLKSMRNLQIYKKAEDDFNEKMVAGQFKNINPENLNKQIPLDLIECTKMESDDSNTEYTEDEEAIPSYQRVIQDQNYLKNLKEESESQIADLKTRPKGWISYRTLAFIASATWFAAYAGLEYYLITTMNKFYKLGTNYSDPDRDEYFYSYLGYKGAFAGVGGTGLVLGGIGAITSFILPSLARKFIPIRISADEFSAFILKLRSSILVNLQFLKLKEQEDKEQYPNKEINYLPTSEQAVDDLENQLDQLEGETKTIDEMIALLEDLDKALSKIQKEQKLTNLPFSFYQSEDTRVEMGNDKQLSSEEESSNESEEAPILKKQHWNI